MERHLSSQPPARAFHGSTTLTCLKHKIEPLETSSWFARVSWQAHDSWMNGGPHLEEGIPYANIIWEAVGLRGRKNHPDLVAPWTRHIRSFAELGKNYGILFVTDNKADAGRYGDVCEIDPTNEAIVDVLEDPHVRTHRGWIVIMKAGAHIPIKQ